ncbi:MAG: AHH domain-containing protein [Planctomyces sp.]|nr:AHH domain-containing protein [Planctomyces sp.]
MSFCRSGRWGNTTSSTGSTANSQLWKGQYLAYRKDPDAGPELQYAMHHRNYNPATGVFTAADPAKDDLNLYRYVKNNPVNRTDPSGLQDDGAKLQKLEAGVLRSIQAGAWASINKNLSAYLRAETDAVSIEYQPKSWYSVSLLSPGESPPSFEIDDKTLKIVVYDESALSVNRIFSRAEEAFRSVSNWHISGRYAKWLNVAPDDFFITDEERKSRQKEATEILGDNVEMTRSVAATAAETQFRVIATISPGGQAVESAYDISEGVRNKDPNQALAGLASGLGVVRMGGNAADAATASRTKTRAASGGSSPSGSSGPSRSSGPPASAAPPSPSRSTPTPSAGGTPEAPRTPKRPGVDDVPKSAPAPDPKVTSSTGALDENPGEEFVRQPKQETPAARGATSSAAPESTPSATQKSSTAKPADDIVPARQGAEAAGTSSVAPNSVLARGTKAREVLAGNLGKHTFPVDAQAHHLFGVELFDTPLGKKLQGWGIDLNGAANGVYLPKYDYAGRVASLHRGRTAGAYTDEVVRRLGAAKNRGQALEILDEIRDDLLNGRLKINGAE